MKHLTLFKAMTSSLAALACTAALAELPVYDEENSVLTIPAIDLPGKPGAFQNAELELNSNNLWELKNVVEAKLNDSIAKVELVQTNTFPVQVFLRISGEYTHGCARTGQTHAAWDGSKLVINSYYENNEWVVNPETVLCTAEVTPFSFVYQVPAYGAPAGKYDYVVNGKFTGSITLTKNNVYESSTPAY